MSSASEVNMDQKTNAKNRPTNQFKLQMGYGELVIVHTEINVGDIASNVSKGFQHGGRNGILSLSYSGWSAMYPMLDYKPLWERITANE